MSTTTETLPRTDDGWTVETLDYLPDEDGTNEVGGDVQVGAAPSVRHRFVSPDGEVMVITTYAFTVAHARRAAREQNMTTTLGPLDIDEFYEIRDKVDREGLRESDFLEYHYEVVAHVDYWEPGNTDEERPDLEDVDYLTDLDSTLGYASLRLAEDAARSFIQWAMDTAPRDWHPSAYLF